MSRSSNPPKLERKTAVPLDYEISDVHVGKTNDNSNPPGVDRRYSEFEDVAVESDSQSLNKPPVEGGRAKRPKSKSKKKKSKSPAKKPKSKKH
jgi:hypothetical protein